MRGLPVSIDVLWQFSLVHGSPILHPPPSVNTKSRPAISISPSLPNILGSPSTPNSGSRRQPERVLEETLPRILPEGSSQQEEDCEVTQTQTPRNTRRTSKKKWNWIKRTSRRRRPITNGCCHNIKQRNAYHGGHGILLESPCQRLQCNPIKH